MATMNQMLPSLVFVLIYAICVQNVVLSVPIPGLMKEYVDHKCTFPDFNFLITNIVKQDEVCVASSDGDKNGVSLLCKFLLLAQNMSCKISMDTDKLNTTFNSYKNDAFCSLANSKRIDQLLQFTKCSQICQVTAAEDQTVAKLCKILNFYYTALSEKQTKGISPAGSMVTMRNISSKATSANPQNPEKSMSGENPNIADDTMARERTISKSSAQSNDTSVRSEVNPLKPSTNIETTTTTDTPASNPSQLALSNVKPNTSKIETSVKLNLSNGTESQKERLYSGKELTNGTGESSNMGNPSGGELQSGKKESTNDTGSGPLSGAGRTSENSGSPSSTGGSSGANATPTRESSGTIGSLNHTESSSNMGGSPTSTGGSSNGGGPPTDIKGSTNVSKAATGMGGSSRTDGSLTGTGGSPNAGGQPTSTGESSNAIETPTGTGGSSRTGGTGGSLNVSVSPSGTGSSLNIGGSPSSKAGSSNEGGSPSVPGGFQTGRGGSSNVGGSSAGTGGSTNVSGSQASTGGSTNVGGSSAGTGGSTNVGGSPGGSQTDTIESSNSGRQSTGTGGSSNVGGSSADTGGSSNLGGSPASTGGSTNVGGSSAGTGGSLNLGGSPGGSQTGTVGSSDSARQPSSNGGSSGSGESPNGTGGSSRTGESPTGTGGFSRTGESPTGTGGFSNTGELPAETKPGQTGAGKSGGYDVGEAWKSSNVNPNYKSKVGVSNTAQGDAYNEPSSGNFMAYFLTAVVLCVAGYVLFHNKQKIVAFIIEGRNGKRTSRRPKTSDYKKLQSNVEEVMPSLEKSTSGSKYVY